ncbi:glycosyltransferase family 2 protein [Vaginisenegalia massiliensis]|uniref:glycosyltransferase family 2 protein n=1 Tax=Vaginisenegalia massiliensis TaxID=2058294 RepID=UPI0013DE4576|nr:glycosyltransferase family 2 protein [Vaginisenegalia massiliensis]
MTKTLTITIPSYNAASYLQETIPTMAEIELAQELEILIVNDGSKDNTLAVAQELSQQYSGVVKVIDKENGGHGSTINAGIQQATGRYFKVVDADDWVKTANLNELVSFLDKLEVDQVISPYDEVYEDGPIVPIQYQGVDDQGQYTRDELYRRIGQIPEMHAICYRTSLLKEHQIRIDENRFYVDLEYIMFPIPFIESVAYFDRPIYQYRKGTSTQSVNINSYIKNRQMHRDVSLALMDFYGRHQAELSQVAKEVIQRRIQEVVAIQKGIFLAMPDSRQSQQEYRDYEAELQSKHPYFYQHIVGKKYQLIRHSHYLLYPVISAWAKHQHA